MDNARQSIATLEKPTLCPRCEGNDANCQFCRGLGRGWLFGGYFVIWAHDPTPAIVQLKRVRDDLRMILRFGAFAIGFLGLIYVVYASLIGISAGQTPFILFSEDSVGGLF